LEERPLKADWLIGERKFRLRCRLLVSVGWVRDYAIFFTIARPISHLPFL